MTTWCPCLRGNRRSMVLLLSLTISKRQNARANDDTRILYLHEEDIANQPQIRYPPNRVKTTKYNM